MSDPVILASASQARAEMLRAAGVEIEVQPARVDEEEIRIAFRAEGASARDLADALAEIKAKKISARRPGALVLGADQTLAAGEDQFDKPRDRNEARAQLLTLRGRTHHLHSAAVIALDGKPIFRHVGTARLAMRPFSERFVDDYLDRLGAAVLDTVGGYHLEGLGAQVFARVDGDHFTVRGLPLLEVLGFLRARGRLIE
ncbi:Maf family protein [uncultured Albimonas sp.]|uniref:Maf family protein n=1 Tax=uncultured Albimonas sp. TaxID=1331701 RepID=UPI0030ECD4AE|tara:strand:- start:6964 stop:7563 length:600 start_codon:yes stop_codon:yes gene_type:complete